MYQPLNRAHQVEQHGAAQRDADVQRRLRIRARQQAQPLQHFSAPAGIAVGLGIRDGQLAAAAGCGSRVAGGAGQLTKGQRQQTQAAGRAVSIPCWSSSHCSMCATKRRARRTLSGDIRAVHPKALHQPREGLQHEWAGRGRAVPHHQRWRVWRPAHRHVGPPEAGAVHPSLLVGEGQGCQGGIIEPPQLGLAGGAGVQRGRLAVGWTGGRRTGRIARRRWPAGEWRCDGGGGGAGRRAAVGM